MAATTKQLKGSRTKIRKILVLLLLLVAVPHLHAQEAPEQPSRSRKVVVSIPHRRLALIEDGAVKKVYPVAVGAQQTPSPTGTFEVRTRLVKPTYYHPGTVIPPGDDNPLGTRWIGLNTKGYGIHGTNVESSIGKPSSHGCIRMHRQDLEELFATVQVGDQVEIMADEDADTESIFGGEQASEAASETAGMPAAIGQ